MTSTSVSRVHAARALAVVTVAFGIGFYLVGAAIKPGYSHLSQYLSEMNATGSAYADLLGFGGFMPLGLLLAGFLIAAAPLVEAHGLARAGFWLLWSQPIAFVGVALWPCDLGCPIDGSANQLAHNIHGLVTYVAGGVSLLLLSLGPAADAPGRGSRWFLRISALLWLVLFVLMLDDSLAPVRGLQQRIADALLAAAVLIVAWRFIPGADPAPTHAPR
jgi:Protein of unknown function (DUF998)